MAFDKFYMIDKDILFENITKIDRQRHAVYHDEAITFFYNMSMWDEFIARYDTWKLENKEVIKDTFTNGDNTEYKFIDITVICVLGRYATSTNLGLTHYFDKDTFARFLSDYNHWYQNQPKDYEDGWYKVTNHNGDANVVKLINNKIHHPCYTNVGHVDINKSAWTNIGPIDPNSDEFYEIISSMVI